MNFLTNQQTEKTIAFYKKYKNLKKEIEDLKKEYKIEVRKEYTPHEVEGEFEVNGNMEVVFYVDNQPIYEWEIENYILDVEEE